MNSEPIYNYEEGDVRYVQMEIAPNWFCCAWCGSKALAEYVIDGGADLDFNTYLEFHWTTHECPDCGQKTLFWESIPWRNDSAE